MSTLEKHQRTTVQDYGPYLEQFELQEDADGFKLVLGAGYQFPLEKSLYRLSKRPETTLAKLFPEDDCCFIDPTADQSVELEEVLGSSVGRLFH